MLIPNSSPESPQPAAFAAAEGSRAPPPHSDALAVALDRRELAVQLQHQASESIVRHQEVRSRADHSYREPLLARPSASSSTRRSSVPARAKKSAGPPARTVVSRASE